MPIGADTQELNIYPTCIHDGLFILSASSSDAVRDGIADATRRRANTSGVCELVVDHAAGALSRIDGERNIRSDGEAGAPSEANRTGFVAADSSVLSQPRRRPGCNSQDSPRG